MPSKAAELRDQTDVQLLERAESAKEELFNLRFQLATGQLDNPSRIRKVRHEIARIATVMRERELEAELDAALAAAEAAAAGGAEERGGTETE
jgi:large subunit ribosomal protein L29